MLHSERKPLEYCGLIRLTRLKALCFVQHRLVCAATARSLSAAPHMEEPAGLKIVDLCSTLRTYGLHVLLFVVSASLTTAAQLFAPLSKSDDGTYPYST
jgi:hypothetical protein